MTEAAYALSRSTVTHDSGAAPGVRVPVAAAAAAGRCRLCRAEDRPYRQKGTAQRAQGLGRSLRADHVRMMTRAAHDTEIVRSEWAR